MEGEEKPKKTRTLTFERVKWLLQRSVKSNKRYTERNAKLKGVILRMKAKVAALRKEQRRRKRLETRVRVQTEELRFIEADAKYYWGILSFIPIQAFLKEKKITNEQLRILTLSIYHKFIVKDDLFEWFVPGYVYVLNFCIRKGLMSSAKINKSKKLMYIPTEKGKQLLEEYKTMIDKYIDVQLKFKTQFKNEKARAKQLRRRPKKVS